MAFLKENNIPEEIIYVFIIEEEEELYRNELQDFNGHIIIGKKDYQHKEILYNNILITIQTSFVWMMMFKVGIMLVFYSKIIH